jgi:tetrahydromethanopterin S-methyltransferase subunit G
MYNYRIGTVSHVDFTPINKKPGFGVNVDDVVKSAFVHFSDPIFDSSDGSLIEKYHFNKLFMGNKNFWSKIESGEPYKLQLPTREYWICLKNKNHIQRTLMNIHQVVENGRYLENLITSQDEEIKNLKKTVEELESKLEGVHQVVYQFVGGLYCHHTQSDMIETHLDVLYGRKPSTKPVNCNIWPTTRQGDEDEKRIRNLERIINLDDDCTNEEDLYHRLRSKLVEPR